MPRNRFINEPSMKSFAKSSVVLGCKICDGVASMASKNNKIFMPLEFRLTGVILGLRDGT